MSSNNGMIFPIILILGGRSARSQHVGHGHGILLGAAKTRKSGEEGRSCIVECSAATFKFLRLVHLLTRYVHCQRCKIEALYHFPNIRLFVNESQDLLFVSQGLGSSTRVYR